MRRRRLATVVVVLFGTGCSYTDRTESVLTYTGSELSGEDVLASLSARLEEALVPRGFECEPHDVYVERGHTVLYAGCRVSDISNPLQGTQTWVSVSFPDDVGSARVQVHTGHVTMHPFTPSTKYFMKWAEVVKMTLCEFSDFEVEHSWPADSEYPISC